MRSRQEGIWSALADALEPPAYAHALPAFGENYLLRIRGPNGGEAIYAVELSTTQIHTRCLEVEPRPVRAPGESIELTLERAVFTRDVLSEGPYDEPSPWLLSVAP